MKLHLGSGNKRIPGFTNVDIQALPEVDVVGPAENLDWVKTDSVDMIYSCHLLEHYGRHQVDAVLREWKRVLKPGGLLRLAVPNFSAVVKEYVFNGNLEPLMGLLYGGQDSDWNHHRVVFDFASLYDRLHRAGFYRVTSWDWRRVKHGRVDDYSQAYLPHMDKINGRLMSLNIQAQATAG